MWMTLNSELSEKPYNTGLSQTDIPKIPFGANAVQGLLLALAWHNDIKLRTWCLGFQCLFLACNSQANADTVDENDKLGNINDIIINDENFEKMLLRFFSGYGMSSTIITNRCVSKMISKKCCKSILFIFIVCLRLAQQFVSIYMSLSFGCIKRENPTQLQLPKREN